MVLSIQTLCSVFSRSTFWFNTAMSLFGKDATSFSHLGLGILCHSSLQILSSSVRLDGKCWWTAIFRSLQRCSIGFKSGLWLGHSRTVTELLWSHSFVILAVCLGSLSCWKVNLRPSLRSWALWRRFSSRISLYLAAFNISLDCNQSSCLCSWKTPPQHDAATTMLHCWDCIGQVMSSAWFSPHILLRIKAKKFYLGLIRPENLICTILESCGLSCVLHWGEASVGPLCHKAPTGGGLQWWLTFYNFLPSPECISGAQPQWSLGSSLPLSPRLFSPDSSVWPDGQL